MKNSKAKAITPIVATILLVVVAVILVTIVLNWGKNFTNSSVSKTDSLVNYNVLNDKQSFMRFKSAQNGMYIFDYYPPSNTDINFKVVGYSLLGYNDYIPLEPEKEITHAGEFMLPLGIINEEKISIALLLEDGSYLTFNNVKNTNRSPAPSQCPTGFVPVPGNYLYGTSGFCVMKWEAKTDANSTVQTACRYDASNYGQWYHLKTGAGYDCNVGKYNIVSTSANYPISMIALEDDGTDYDARDACASIGGHVITNEEWMTIARNIETVPENWSSGIVGQGYLPRGNSNNIKVGNSYVYDGGTVGSDANKRSLKLTNGSEVWDLSGNVYDWSDKVQTDYYFADCDIVNPSGDCVVDEEKQEVSGEYPEIYTQLNYLQNIGYKDLFLLNSDYNSDNGIGYFWNYYYGSDVAFLRGGDWDNGARAGVLGLDADRDPSGTSSSIGFRCVVEPT
jgi:hypothetical protein